MKKRKMIKEAIKRMKKLNLHENVVKELEEENKLNISRNNGSLFWLNYEEKEMVKKFERETENFVYHVIHNKTQVGNLYTFLYVTKSKEEWKLDNQDLEDNICLTYVFNKENDYLSEYGYIKFRRMMGGLVRIA